jgi:hypothetical protein
MDTTGTWHARQRLNTPLEAPTAANYKITQSLIYHAGIVLNQPYATMSIAYMAVAAHTLLAPKLQLRRVQMTPTVQGATAQQVLHSTAGMGS